MGWLIPVMVVLAVFSVVALSMLAYGIWLIENDPREEHWR